MSQTRRELTEEESAAPAVQKMLLDELDRLDSEKAELVRFRADYYAADRACAVLRAQFKAGVATDIISTASMTVGSVLLGLAPSLWTTSEVDFSILVALGFVLIICGVAAKVIFREQ